MYSSVLSNCFYAAVIVLIVYLSVCSVLCIALHGVLFSSLLSQVGRGPFTPQEWLAYSGAILGAEASGRLQALVAQSARARRVTMEARTVGTAASTFWLSSVGSPILAGPVYLRLSWVLSVCFVHFLACADTRSSRCCSRLETGALPRTCRWTSAVWKWPWTLTSAESARRLAVTILNCSREIQV